jgi:serine protease Do
MSSGSTTSPSSQLAATELVALSDDSASTLSSLANAEAAADTAAGEELLARRVHAEVATSLPRVQAATATGMREGSGMFVTDQGHIATSAGLINGADYVLVWTEDDRRWEARVVATDEFSDVAVLQIQSTEWPAASLGSDARLWSGQYALAIDHAAKNVRIGQVTAVDPSRVRVDQPVALPGSAIVDDSGAVIAMVNADGSNSSATPSWMVEQVALDLIVHGSAVHTWLGLTAENSPDGLMAVVVDVVPDSPAAAAGLRPGDLIDTIDGELVSDAPTLWRYVQQAEPGDSAALTLTRNNSRRLVVVTVGELPD